MCVGRWTQLMKKVGIDATPATAKSDCAASPLLDSGFFLNLCSSPAASDGVAMGGMRTKTKWSGFWVSRSLLMTDGLFPLADPRSAFAPTVVGEAEVGMAGPNVTSRIYQSRASQ